MVLHIRLMIDHFNAAYARWLALEGPDSNDPDDPGGLTRFGISQKYNPEIDVASLTPDSARAFFYQKYWLSVRLNLIQPKNLAIKTLTLGGLLGPVRAVKLLQSACNALGAELMVDGVIGPRTAVWVNGYRHPLAVEEVMETHATTYLLVKGKKKYIAGWLIRVDG